MRAKFINEISRQSGKALDRISVGKSTILAGYQYLVKRWPNVIGVLHRRGIGSLEDNNGSTIRSVVIPYVEELMQCHASDVLFMCYSDLTSNGYNYNDITPAEWMHDVMNTDKYKRKINVPIAVITPTNDEIYVSSVQSLGMMELMLKIPLKGNKTKIRKAIYILIRYK